MRNTAIPTTKLADRPRRDVGHRAETGEAQVVEQRPEDLDEPDHRVERVPRPQPRRHQGDRVDDRRRVEPQLEADAHQVLQVAEVHVEHRQDQADARDEHGEHDHGQDHAEQPGQDHVAEHQQEHHEQAHLDDEAPVQRQDRGEDQDLAGEVDLLDEPGVAQQGHHRVVHAVGQEVPGQQAAQQEGRVVDQARGVADGRLDLQELAEDQREDDHRGQRVEQRPRPPEHRTLVLAPQLAQRQVDQQVPRLGQVSQGVHRGKGLQRGGQGRPRRAAPVAPVVEHRARPAPQHRGCG